MRLFNPDDLPVDLPVEQQARWILSRHEIPPSTAAGRVFIYGYVTTGGRGGELRFEPRTRLMSLCEIASEAAARKAISVLAKAGLVQRIDQPRRGQACALVLRFLCVYSPPAQQIFPELDHESPTVAVVGDGADASAGQGPERTGSAHSECALTQSVTDCSRESIPPLCKQPEHSARECAPQVRTGSAHSEDVQFVQDGGQGGGEDSEGQIEEVEDEADDDPGAAPVGLRFLTAVRRIEQKLDFARVIPQWRWQAPAWAYAFVCGVLSEHELEDSLQYAVEIPRDKLRTGNRVKACAGKLRNILHAKVKTAAGREQLHRHMMLDAAGKPRWPRFAALKRTIRAWGVGWDDRWDQKPWEQARG